MKTKTKTKPKVVSSTARNSVKQPKKTPTVTLYVDLINVLTNTTVEDHEVMGVLGYFTGVYVERVRRAVPKYPTRRVVNDNITKGIKVQREVSKVKYRAAA